MILLPIGQNRQNDSFDRNSINTEVAVLPQRITSPCAKNGTSCKNSKISKAVKSTI